MISDTYIYNSVDVAWAIIAYANSNKYYINMTKLQKLLYITYGTYLAVKGERLTDEHPQAWPYGPVFPTTRNKLLSVDFATIRSKDSRLCEINQDNEMQSLLGVVFRAFGKSNAASLSEWSHEIGSPWDKTVKQPDFKWGNRIPDDYIKEYFESIIIRKANV